MTLKPLSALITCIAAIFGFTSLLEAPRGLSGQPTANTTPALWDNYPETTIGQLTTTQTSLPTTIANCDDVVHLARLVGWPEDELDTLAVVALRESNCVPTAHNADDPHGGSYGLMQINGFWCEPNSAWPMGWLQVQDVGVTECGELYIPEANLRAALAIWKRSGWSPWATK